MSKQLVTFQVDGDVALIGLNRAAKRNAIGDALIEALGDAVRRAETEAKAMEEGREHILFYFRHLLRTSDQMNSPPGYLPVDRLRKRLEPMGIQIDTVHGQGWQMGEAARERFRGHLAPVVA